MADGGRFEPGAGDQNEAPPSDEGRDSSATSLKETSDDAKPQTALNDLSNPERFRLSEQAGAAQAGAGGEGRTSEFLQAHDNRRRLGLLHLPQHQPCARRWCAGPLRANWTKYLESATFRVRGLRRALLSGGFSQPEEVTT
jgi:hypothetical protein